MWSVFLPCESERFHERGRSPVSNLFLKQATQFEFSSLSPAPDWLLCFQSGTEETFEQQPLCLGSWLCSEQQSAMQLSPGKATLQVTFHSFSPPSALVCPWPPHCTEGESKPVPGGQRQGESTLHRAAASPGTAFLAEHPGLGWEKLGMGQESCQGLLSQPSS